MLLLVATPIVRAQQGGNALQISPTRTEISANQGEQKPFTITLKNITQGELVAKAIVNDFSSDNETGIPQIIVDTSQRTPYSISSWIKGLSDVTLKPGETKEVKLSVDVPAGATPGAYFGAIRYALAPKDAKQSDEDRQVSLNASVAHIVFVEVPGNTVEQIKVESLVMQQGDKKGSFFFKAPNKSNLKIKNLGNGFSRPFGQVSISRALGGQVYSYDVNNRDPRGIILPNSSRTFTDDIKNIKVPGKYTATASVAYGSGGEVVNYKSTFWYVPVWLIILLIVLAILLIAFIVAVYRKKYTFHRKKKR
jgi:hypothetical protein